jgi:protein involved in polysaccharide export with SLBB domain
MEKVFKTTGLLAVCLLSALLGVGCVTGGGGGEQFDPSKQDHIEAAGRSDFRAGDEVTVVLSDYPGGPAKFSQKVSDDGQIVLHLNQSFSALRKKPEDLQREIHQRYVPDYYPRMTVLVRAEEQYIYVRGYVEQDGRFPYSPGMTVLKAIATARGFNPFAKTREVQVTRLNGKTIKVDCEKAKDDARYDLPVYPGDIIYVPRRHI